MIDRKIWETTSVLPFAVSLTTKLAQGLQHTSAAIERVVVDDTLEPFREAVDSGVSANLCDSIAELAKKGEGISIDLAWAGVRPSTLPESHFQFSPASADILAKRQNRFDVGNHRMTNK